MLAELTKKQRLLLRMAGTTLLVWLAFRYLIPLLLPFLIAALVSLVIRPLAGFLHRKLHIPMGIAAAAVLAVILSAAGMLIFFVGRMAVEQLILLWEQLPRLWQETQQWLWDCCGWMEENLHLEPGAVSRQVSRMVKTGGGSMEGWSSLLGTSFRGLLSTAEKAVSWLVAILITIGATLIITTHWEEIKKGLERSLFRRELRRVFSILARVGSAYGKTQLVIMVCTVAVSAVGLTLLGDPYALLWAAAIGLVDALPLFGTGTILWPWILLSALRGQLGRTIGLAAIYVVSNLLRQWLEARYMGDRIGLSPLENLVAMYLGLQLFGVLGLFWGPIGYLLIKETAGSEIF